MVVHRAVPVRGLTTMQGSALPFNGNRHGLAPWSPHSRRSLHTRNLGTMFGLHTCHTTGQTLSKPNLTILLGLTGHRTSVLRLELRLGGVHALFGRPIGMDSVKVRRSRSGGCGERYSALLFLRVTAD